MFSSGSGLFVGLVVCAYVFPTGDNSELCTSCFRSTGELCCSASSFRNFFQVHLARYAPNEAAISHWPVLIGYKTT